MICVEDADFTLHVGDVRDVLATLEDGSVDCVITSPPYWGLRDYGTGAWAGGDPDCDHMAAANREDRARNGLTGGTATVEAATIYRDRCGKCGATRVDQQLGLEATPDEYVANMVAVFRDVWRVLADHGTCWVNLGDSYANSGGCGKEGGTIGGKDTPQIRPPRTGPIPEKNLVGIPWRVAFALQADGWYLRSDIIWSKPNPMPESVTDRPTKAHEYVFLLTKRPRYWFDAEAVREPQTSPDNSGNPNSRSGVSRDDYVAIRPDGPLTRERIPMRHRVWNPAGRNVRSVWEIATQPYPEAHFATYPEELVRRCLLAGCPEWVCGTCGKARERIVERETMVVRPTPKREAWQASDDHARTQVGGTMLQAATSTTLGWSDCGHNDYRPGVVLDPFLGSGTTALVARRHGRRCVGVELSPDYARLAARRLQQLSLLA